MSHTRDPGSKHPYRVGMARATQRYIEPDEIYPDLSRGRPTTMPRQFPWTWNPVNGLGAVSSPSSSARIDGFFDDLLRSGSGLVEDVTKDTTESVSSELEKFIRSGPGAEFLNKVEDKAAEGVVKVVKQEAPNLIALAIAGGAVGGALSSKLGKTGTVLALVVGAYAASQILKAVAPKSNK